MAPAAAAARLRGTLWFDGPPSTSSTCLHAARREADLRALQELECKLGISETMAPESIAKSIQTLLAMLNHSDDALRVGALSLPEGRLRARTYRAIADKLEALLDADGGQCS